MSIPKIIHYCWFGGNSLNKKAIACIESWKKFCPNFEIVCWDEKNSPLEDNAYVEQAYALGKWAFVSDYVRLKALWEQGGIYLDTDVELTKGMEDLLGQQAFCGFESDEKIATCLIASRPKHALIGELLEEYGKASFVKKDGSPDLTTNVERITKFLKGKGLVCDGAMQNVADLTIYPVDWFSPKSLTTGKLVRTKNTRAIHHFQSSWMTMSQRRNTKIAQILGPKWTAVLKQKLGRC